MPRFVILRHETPPGYPRPTHFDLMLQSGATLRTWALTELPAPGLTVAAEELPPHRLDYLDYEGDVTNGRGSVARVAAGEYEIRAQDGDLLRLWLQSPEIAGMLELARNLPEESAWTAKFASTK